MRVQVYVYDLTRGLAATLSPMLLGTRVGTALQHVMLASRHQMKCYTG